MTRAHPPTPAARDCRCHVCRPDPSYDDLDRQTIETVRRHGWQVIMVSEEAGCCAGDHDPTMRDDDPGPAFAYTVGLGHRARHPELLMSGLDPHLMHRALNGVAERILAGRRLRPGDVLEDVLAGVPVVVERASDVALHTTVTWSGWFHRRRPQALVLVWPTRSGLFAWQPGAPASLDEQQPPVWRVPIEHTGGVAADPTWVLPVPPDGCAFSCTHVVECGDAVLYAVRQPGGLGEEDWTIHCGAAHDLEEMRSTHLAHLVRSAPSLRELADLALDHEAERTDVDSPWTIAALPG